MARYRPHDSSDVRPAETLTNLYCLRPVPTFSEENQLFAVLL